MLQEFKSRRITARELIRLAFAVYAQNFKLILVIGLGVYVPSNIVLTLLASRLDLSAVFTMTDLTGAVRFIAVTMILTVAVLPLATAAVTYFTRQKLESADASLEGALDASLGNWWRLFITGCMYMVLVSLCSFLIIPAILFGVLFCFYPQIIAVEQLSGFAALSRSAMIVRRRWWRTLGVLLIVFVTEFAFQTMAASLLDLLFSALFGALSAPFTQILSTFASVLLDMCGIVFKIVTALYFFNLYYTAARPVMETPQ